MPSGTKWVKRHVLPAGRAGTSSHKTEGVLVLLKKEVAQLTCAMERGDKYLVEVQMRQRREKDSGCGRMTMRLPLHKLLPA